MHVRSACVPMMLLALAAPGISWARCSIERQASNLEMATTRCSQRQLDALQTVLSNRLQFRESLDLPLAEKVLEERKCPSAEEFRVFFAAWKQLERAGFTYTVKKYCLAPPTFYHLRPPDPDKPLDDAAVSSLAADIERLQNAVIPALASKSAEVNGRLGSVP
jgi:hypothetical protein